MRIPNFLIFLQALFFIPILSSAQKIKKTTQEYEWSTIRLINAAEERSDVYEPDRYAFEKYNLPITAREKIIPVRHKKKWNIVRVNDDGKVLWEFEGTADNLAGIGLVGPDVIAFYATGNSWDFKKLTAVLVSGTGGIKLKERVIYESASSIDGIQVRVQNNTNGVFNNVMLITDERKKDPFIQLFYVDADLLSKPVLLKPSFTFTKFAGSLVNSNGEIFVADFSEEQFVVSKFNKEGKELKKIATPIKRKRDYFTTMLQPDKNNAEAIIIGLKYKSEKKDWINQLYRFDMAAGKVISSEGEILDKDYARSLTLEKVKGVSDGNLKWIEDAQLAGLVQWKDKWVLIKEIRNSVPSGDRNTRYINHAWIASIYDADLKLRKTIGLDKRHESFLSSSLSLGFGIQNDKLIVIAPALTGIASTAVTLVSVNMQTEQIEKAVALDQLQFNAASGIEAGATLWFNDSFLLQQLKGGGGFINRTPTCVLYKIEM